MMPEREGCNVPFKLIADEPINISAIWSPEDRRFAICVADVVVALPDPSHVIPVYDAIRATVERLAKVVPIDQRAPFPSRFEQVS